MFQKPERGVLEAWLQEGSDDFSGEFFRKDGYNDRELIEYMI